jgi:hypothetical protein
VDPGVLFQEAGEAHPLTCVVPEQGRPTPCPEGTVPGRGGACDQRLSQVPALLAPEPVDPSEHHRDSQRADLPEAGRVGQIGAVGEGHRPGALDAAIAAPAGWMAGMIAVAGYGHSQDMSGGAGIDPAAATQPVELVPMSLPPASEAAREGGDQQMTVLGLDGLRDPRTSHRARPHAHRPVRMRTHPCPVARLTLDVGPPLGQRWSTNREQVHVKGLGHGAAHRPLGGNSARSNRTKSAGLECDHVVADGAMRPAEHLDLAHRSWVERPRRGRRGSPAMTCAGIGLRGGTAAGGLAVHRRRPPAAARRDGVEPRTVRDGWLRRTAGPP